MNDTLFGFLVEEDFLTSKSLVVQTPPFLSVVLCFVSRFLCYKVLSGFLLSFFSV
jgi:hypothetical protein